MKPGVLWWPFVKKNKLGVTAVILLGLAASYFSILLPLSIGKYFEISFSGGLHKTRALQLLGVVLPDGVLIFFSFFLVITLLKFFCSWGYIYYSSLLGESFAAVLRSRFLQHHLKPDPEVPIPRKAGILFPFSNDMKMMQQLLVKGVMGLVKDLLFLGMALYVLFFIQPLLTATVVVMTGLFYGLHRWFNQVHKPLFARKRKKQAALLNQVVDLLENKRENIQPDLTGLNKKTERLRLTLQRYHARKSLLAATIPFMLYLMLAVIMIMVTLGTGRLRLPPGEVVIYILLLMTLFPTFRNIIRVEHIWVQGGLAAEKFVKTAEGPDTEITGKSSKKATNNSFSLLQTGVKGN